ncbi:hypothetical protein KA082_01245 [Candidatus Woesebacteria bacterium]|nr:hypothetical protein [Candidatus Woesebacteria bacterium]
MSEQQAAYREEMDSDATQQFLSPEDLNRAFADNDTVDSFIMFLRRTPKGTSSSLSLPDGLESLRVDALADLMKAKYERYRALLGQEGGNKENAVRLDIARTLPSRIGDLFKKDLDLEQVSEGKNKTPFSVGRWIKGMFTR